MSIPTPQEETVELIRFGRDRALTREAAEWNMLYDLALRLEGVHGDHRITETQALAVLQRVHELEKAYRRHHANWLVETGRIVRADSPVSTPPSE